MHFASKAIVTAVVLLAGCQTTTTPEPALRAEPPELATSEIFPAFQAFSHICYGSAPSFATAEQRARSIGFDTKLPDGSLVRTDDGLSVKLFNGSARRVCSFSFVTNEPSARYVETMREPFNASFSRNIPSIGDGYMSRATNFEGGVQGLFLASAGTKIGQATQYEILLTFEN